VLHLPENRHFGKISQKKPYFPDISFQDLWKSALFVKKGVLNFSIPSIPARFNRNMRKSSPEKSAIRRYWKPNLL